MKSRKPFPVSWRGVLNMNFNLENHPSGISGVYFVHNSGFLANLDMKENALKFAEKALNYKTSFGKIIKL